MVFKNIRKIKNKIILNFFGQLAQLATSPRQLASSSCMSGGERPDFKSGRSVVKIFMGNQPGMYIIQSRKNSKYYIGSTENISSRLMVHNNGEVKATKLLIPWELKFFQLCHSIRGARQLEYRLKKLKRKDIIEGIIKE